MKIVLDTNVLISGIFWKGTPHRILEMWAKNKIQILVTENILNEYFKIIREIDEGRGVSENWIVFIAQNAIVLKDTNIIKICRDPKDNMFLNCSVFGKANYLVTGDKDLNDLKEIKSLKIVKPARFVEIMKKRR